MAKRTEKDLPRVKWIRVKRRIKFPWLVIGSIPLPSRGMKNIPQEKFLNGESFVPSDLTSC
jgi:hypothetical protein